MTVERRSLNGLPIMTNKGRVFRKEDSGADKPQLPRLVAPCTQSINQSPAMQKLLSFDLHLVQLLLPSRAPDFPVLRE